MNCVTLLTDFGLEDEYVGVMKGVILTIHPAARIIDISHGIPAQDVSAAARMLLSAYRWFPRETVHVCVVDPGVGTGRAIVAARAGEHVFVAPDNGVLFPLMKEVPVEALVQVENSVFFLPEVSRTFHGRDIFAPVAAHLLRGVPVPALGPPIPIDQMVPLGLPKPRTEPDGSLVGTVIGADRFGNLLTDIESRHLALLKASGTTVEIRVGGTTIPGISETYGPPNRQTGIAVIGSRGSLEIAVSGGNARRLLKVNIGDSVSIRRKVAVEEIEQDP